VEGSNHYFIDPAEVVYKHEVGGPY